MKKNIIITLLAAASLTSCGEYNKLLKSTDYEYKYEAAKNYFAKGQYNRSATLLNELITILKGTDKAEESLYMLGMSTIVESQCCVFLIAYMILVVEVSQYSSWKERSLKMK